MNTVFRLTTAAAIFLSSVVAVSAGNRDDCLQDQDATLAARACPLYQAELAAARADTAPLEAAEATPKTLPETAALPAQNWLLNPANSKISITSVKQKTTSETHFFKTLDGSIDPSGNAIVTIDLSSLDTSIDIRNVRMRFLFFETFKFPTATVSAKLDAAEFETMAVGDTVALNQPVNVDLHGVQMDITANLVAIRVSENMVKVVSTEPIIVPATDFNLVEGVTRLSEAAGGIDIQPSGKVTFDLNFEGGDSSAELLAARASVEQGRAEETTRALTPEECQNRMVVISQTRAIYFASGSARINQVESAPVLDEVAQFFNRCPSESMVIAGHTDSDGSASYNQDLSERRAAAVAEALLSRAVDAARMNTTGLGETQPVAKNATPAGKAKNRRIEFNPMGG